jgi:cytoskeleton protein RodZ
MPESDPDNGGDVSGLGLGERIRSARKARALSLEQVSESLHLDENIILALEEERFDALGAPVFVRGHLRTYARLVGLPVGSVLDAYAKADPNDGKASPVITRDTTDRAVAINPIMWGFWGLVALVGLALMAYVFQGNEPAPVVAAPEVENQDVSKAEPRVILETDTSIFSAEEPVPAQQEETSDLTAARETEDRSEQNIAAGVAEPVAESVADLGAEPVVEPVIERPSQTVRLSLHFRQESWVEISDVNRRLLFGLQREGRRRELTAEPPIQLLIGNASGVDLSVDDEPYSVPMAGVTGKVARFEISPPARD